MLKLILILALLATPALAIEDYTLTLCDDPENDCYGLTVTSDQHPGIGQPFSIVLDLDIYNGAQGDICAVWVRLPIDEQRVEFLNSSRLQQDPANQASCYTSTSGYDATTVLCKISSPWGRASGQIISEESAEVRLDFLMLDPTDPTDPTKLYPMEFNGDYAVAKWIGGTCNTPSPNTPIESTLRVVPEPGALLSLVAGLPVLAWMRGRKR